MWPHVIISTWPSENHGNWRLSFILNLSCYWNGTNSTWSLHHNDFRLEICWFDVCLSYPGWIQFCSILPRPGDQTNNEYSYNRYLAVAARTVRRSLKEGPRAQAERRGLVDLRFAKWEVRSSGWWSCWIGADNSRTASRVRPRLWIRPTRKLWLVRLSPNKSFELE